MSPLPSNLEKVAEAGGWDERAKQKAQEELMKKMAKIPTEKWKTMLSTVVSLEKIVDKGGLDLAKIPGMIDSIKDAVSTELDFFLAPLKNDLTAAVNEALDPLMELITPLMPAITTTLTGLITPIAFAIESWIAVFTGDWSKVIDMAKSVPGWVALQKEYYDRAIEVMTALFEETVIKYTGMTYNELDIQGTAGGVYSGQFDIDLDALADMYGLGDYTG